VEILSLRHAEMGSLAVRREWTDWAAPGTSREPIIPLPGPLESKMVMRFRCAVGSGGRTVNVIR
jgi:hypothetical protein